MGAPAIELSGISKRFGGIQALKNVSLDIAPAEIHALVGENGAGKSTLMKVLSGAVVKDEGSITVFGKKTDLGNTILSRSLGIGIIYQEFSLAPDLSIAENIFLGDLKGGRKSLLLPLKDLVRKSREILGRLGVNLDPRRLVRTLPVAYQQIVEIAKALSGDAKVLILDEPTAVLTDAETEKLFEVLMGLRRNGKAIIYISHRLEEVFRISERISVMKDGELVATHNTRDLDKNRVISLMTGREFSTLFPKRSHIEVGEELLRVENLSAANGVHDLTLSLRRGEILGLSGLIGAGRTEFAKAVFGLDRITGGTVYVKGKPVSIKSVADAKKHRIGLIPDDRKHSGLTLDMSILANISMANIRQIVRNLVMLDFRKEREIGQRLADSLRLKAGKLSDNASSLSGGNQQKIVIAKWLNTNSEIVIFDEPTRGVDVGAKYEIYQIMNGLVEQGYGVIIISSEMSEIIGMADRILVFNEGTVAGELSGEEVGEEEIMKLAIPASVQEGVRS